MSRFKPSPQSSVNLFSLCQNTKQERKLKKSTEGAKPPVVNTVLGVSIHWNLSV